MKNKIFSFLTYIMITSFLLPACSIITQISINYLEEARELIIYAHNKTWPGAYLAGQTCNLIPDLRIWGDGRYVKVIYRDGIRTILSGYLSKDELTAVLNNFDEAGYFNLDERININQAATGLELDIHLSSKSFHYLSWQPDQTFVNIIESVHAENEQIYFPTQAYMIALPANRPLPAEEIILWPETARFHLSEIGEDGMWIDGEELTLIWDAINHDPINMPVFSEAGRKYIPVLQVEGVSWQDPPFECK